MKVDPSICSLRAKRVMDSNFPHIGPIINYWMVHEEFFVAVIGLILKMARQSLARLWLWQSEIILSIALETSLALTSRSIFLVYVTNETGDKMSFTVVAQLLFHLDIVSCNLTAGQCQKCFQVFIGLICLWLLKSQSGQAFTRLYELIYNSH